MNEGLYLLRAGGAEAALYYYLGSIPFMLVMLFFWSDMARSGFALQHMVLESLLLACLFSWMKVWQAIFSRRLHELRTGNNPTKITVKHWFKVLVNQVTVQPWGLLFIPLSMLLVIPFARVHAFFQNYCLLDDGGDRQELSKQASKQARLWPMQNHLLIWLLSPWLLSFLLVICFGGAMVFVSLMGNSIGSQLLVHTELPWLFIGVLLLIIGVWPSCPLALAVAANIGLVLYVVPQMLNSLFGVETVFVRGGIYSIGNSTVLLAIYGLTYLVLDPVMKSTYVLRCFYGASAVTGADLLADLKKTVMIVLALTVTLGVFNPPARAQDQQSVIPQYESVLKLDRAIESTLQQDEYAWRIPRPKRKLSFSLPFVEMKLPFLVSLSESISNAFRWIGTYVENFFDWIGEWLDGFFKSPEKESELSSETDLRGMVKSIVYLLAGMSAIFGIWQLFKLSKQRLRRARVEEPVVEPVVPDLTDEAVSADLLPEEQWLQLAAKMMAENKLRLALRAFYLAGLACLGHWRIIKLEPSKSNREYGFEINRYSSSYPDIPRLFAENVHLFEKVWYGDYPVKSEELVGLQDNQNRIRGYFADNQR